MRRSPFITPLLLGAALCLACPGCVTERSTPSANRTGKVGPVSRPKPAPRPVSAEPVAMPDAPVASPVIDSRMVNSEVRVAIKPVGGIPFDGQTLPLISPDARFLATQTGEAPDWPTILAQNAASPPTRTKIEIYDLTRDPIRRIKPADALPAGAMLGRACTSTSFLVEVPRPDASRWIGAVDFATGKFRWLVQGETVNAHAITLDWSGPPERLVFTRRAVGDVTSHLILLNHGVETDLGPAGAGVSAFLPSLGAFNAPALMSLESTGVGLELVARMMRHDDIGDVAARRQIAGADASNPLLVAFQAMSPVMPWLDAQAARSDAAAVETPPAFLFHNPLMARMCLFDPRSATITALAPKSVSGAWNRDPVGWTVFLSTPEGLLHQRIIRDDDTGDLTTLPPSKVLGDPYVPRATMDPERPFVLIGPGPNESNRLQILLMHPIAEP